MDFENWLKPLADEGGSDLYLTTGAPPSAKFDGELKPLSDERLSPGFTRDLAYELMDGQQARELKEKLEMNLAISLPGVGRFRVNIFKQRNEVKWEWWFAISSSIFRQCKNSVYHQSSPT